jgi:hypothetical protein
LVCSSCERATGFGSGEWVSCYSFHFRPKAFLVFGKIGRIWRRFICGQVILRGRGLVNLRTNHGGRYWLMVMVISCGLMVKLVEGVGNAPTSAMPILFSRQVQPAYICLPSKNWSGWQELHLRPPRSEQGRLLLTLHPENWLPGLDSHQHCAV